MKGIDILKLATTHQISNRAGLLDLLADALRDKLVNEILELAGALTLDDLNHLLADGADL